MQPFGRNLLCAAVWRWAVGRDPAGCRRRWVEGSCSGVRRKQQAWAWTTLDKICTWKFGNVNARNIKYCTWLMKSMLCRLFFCQVDRFMRKRGLEEKLCEDIQRLSVAQGYPCEDWVHSNAPYYGTQTQHVEQAETQRNAMESMVLPDATLKLRDPTRNWITAYWSYQKCFRTQIARSPKSHHAQKDLGDWSGI